jgi:hypothetical protein
VDKDDAAKDSSDNYIASPIPHHSSTSPDALDENSDLDSVILFQPKGSKPKKKLGTSNEKPVVTGRFNFFFSIFFYLLLILQRSFFKSPTSWGI